MNKYNLLSILTVALSIVSLSFPAHSESFGRQKAKQFQAGFSQSCVRDGTDADLCACQSNLLSSPTFLMFSESIKTDADLPKMQEYYQQNIYLSCLLDQATFQKMCSRNMKEKEPQYSDRSLGEYCKCMSDEVNERIDRNSLKGMDKYQLQAALETATHKAHPFCNHVHR